MIGKTISHYKILSRLGEGGMGVVYKAEDLKLGRFVALKFLTSPIEDDQTRLRFVREARAASALEHPNICSIHEIDETPEGRMFIVMPCYDGESLEARIQRSPLTVAESVDIAIQIASGLSKAHEKGIVHRDIKPANILLTRDGLAKIVDFGLAKLSTQTKLTKFGTTVGTAMYMSPEQVKGDDVDHRSDIWSLGVMLYEMLTGKPPFKGDIEAAVLYSIINKDPDPIAMLRTGVPPELERIVGKCIAKDPAARYQTAADLAVDLRTPDRAATGRSPTSKPPVDAQRKAMAPYWRIALAIFAAAIVTVALLIVFDVGSLKDRVLPRTASHGTGRIGSLAIMPFTNAGGDPDTEYLSDEIPADIINALSRLPDLRVVPRSTVFRYKGREPNLAALGRELSVGAVLTGQIRVRGEEISIRAELVDVVNDRQLWGDRYTRQLADILSLEQQLAAEISDALKLQLSSTDLDRLGESGTQNAEAHRLYLKGRYLWNKRSEEGIESSIGYFERAIERDPAYALAYSGLADAYTVLVGFGYLSPRDAFPKAKAAAMRAIEIDSTLAEAHPSLAWVLGSYEWDWAGAEREFKRAIELDPSYATTLHWYSFHLVRMGRIDEAIAASERAIELDPLSIMITSNLGYWYFVARRYETAEKQCLKAIEMDASFSWAHTVLGLVYAQRGMYEQSVDELTLATKLSGSGPEAVAYLGYGFAVAGRVNDARKILDEMARRAEHNYVPPCYFALIHVGLGEKEKAFEWLDKAYEVRDSYLSYQLFEPSYDPIRDDPRFGRLLRAMGLDPSLLNPASSEP